MGLIPFAYHAVGKNALLIFPSLFIASLWGNSLDAGWATASNVNDFHVVLRRSDMSVMLDFMTSERYALVTGLNIGETYCLTVRALCGTKVSKEAFACATVEPPPKRLCEISRVSDLRVSGDSESLMATWEAPALYDQFSVELRKGDDIISRNK